jgi:hypothetical protein
MMRKRVDKFIKRSPALAAASLEVYAKSQQNSAMRGKD